MCNCLTDLRTCTDLRNQSVNMDQVVLNFSRNKIHLSYFQHRTETCFSAIKNLRYKLNEVGRESVVFVTHSCRKPSAGNTMRSHCIFVIGVIFMSVTIVLCAPTKDSQEMIGPDVKEFYDQRQNGTENFRIDIKDFAIVITPLETLLNVATMLDPIFLEGFKRSDLPKEPTLDSNITETEVATEAVEEENNVSSETKSKRGLKSRIGSLILPFIRRHH